jgi:hypothetical protein
MTKTAGLKVGDGPETKLAAMMDGDTPAWALDSAGAIKVLSTSKR